jgi:predicted dehydrogenase
MDAMKKKIALLGCDSTHAEAYGELISLPDSPFYKDAEIVSLWGTDHQEALKKAKNLGIKRVHKNVTEAIQGVDLILILNRFGEERFELAELALAAGKPVFADKPLTMNMDQAKALVEMYQQKQIPLFSASAFRLAEDTQKFKARLKEEKVIGGVICGPFQCVDLGNDPRLQNIFFYGIHLVEMMQEVFGSGIQSIKTQRSEKHGDSSIITYQSELQVSLHLLKPMVDYYHVTAYTESGPLSYKLDLEGNYYEQTLSRFFQFVDGSEDGVPLGETLEALELLFASESSVHQGIEVTLNA